MVRVRVNWMSLVHQAFVVEITIISNKRMADAEDLKNMFSI